MSKEILFADWIGRNGYKWSPSMKWWAKWFDEWQLSKTGNGRSKGYLTFTTDELFKKFNSEQELERSVATEEY